MLVEGGVAHLLPPPVQMRPRPHRSCWTASVAVWNHLGWPVVEGLFDEEPWNDCSLTRTHFWNLMPDGRIFDATAGQFGFKEPLITDASNPLYLAHEVVVFG